MKTKLVVKFLTALLAVFVISCGSDNGGDEPGTQTTSITIASSASSVAFGEAFTFTVTDNNGNNVTSQSTIYFNGSAISGATHTSAMSGYFTVNAKYNGLTSPNISVSVDENTAVTSIVLTANTTHVLLGETITLTATGNGGTDLTSTAAFYVNGTAITGNTYTASARGYDVATATQENVISNELPLVTGYTQKVLIEDYTGTWCGWCPRVSYGIELVEAETNNSVPVAIHRGSDPYNYAAASALESYIGLTGYPTAMLNRKTTWSYPEPNNVAQVVNLTSGGSAVGLSVSSTLSANALEISVNMDMLVNALDGEKLVVYIMENGLIYDQVNYTSYYAGADPITGFEHNNVLRQVPTDLFGDAILSSELDGDSDTYAKTFNVTLDSSIEDNSKLSLAVFVVNTSGDVLNAKAALVGETKSFED